MCSLFTQTLCAPQPFLSLFCFLPWNAFPLFSSLLIGNLFVVLPWFHWLCLVTFVFFAIPEVGPTSTLVCIIAVFRILPMNKIVNFLKGESICLCDLWNSAALCSEPYILSLFKKGLNQSKYLFINTANNCTSIKILLVRVQVDFSFNWGWGKYNTHFWE